MHRLLREDAEKAENRPHDLRLWERAALCVACGAFSSDPALLGACAPIGRSGDYLFCLAVSSEGRGAESVCGKKRFAANVEQPFPQVRSCVRLMSRRTAHEMLGSLLESRTHGRADCPDCLRIAAGALAPYRAAHDPRLLGGGVACADCGAFAARAEDMGECDRGYALEVAGKRRAEPRSENGSRSRTLLWIGMQAAAPMHAEGGCGRSPWLLVRRGELLPSPAGGSASVRAGRITCRLCLRIAKKAPGMPAAAA